MMAAKPATRLEPCTGRYAGQYKIVGEGSRGLFYATVFPTVDEQEEDAYQVCDDIGRIYTDRTFPTPEAAHEWYRAEEL